MSSEYEVVVHNENCLEAAVNAKSRFSWGLVLIVSSIAILTIAGCRKHSAIREEAARAEAASSSTPSHPIGGTYCLDTFANGAALAHAIHFSYKKSETDGSFKNFEGDLSGDNLDSSVHEKRPATDIDREMNKEKALTPVPIVDGFVETTRTDHYTRSDASAWSMGSGGSVKAFAPWGLFIAKPEVKQVGTENVAGFDAVKYSVDTSQQSQLDKSPMTIMGGLTDYTIKGNAWVDKNQQCIVQYTIDYEENRKDGTVKKTHYEGSTTKK
jgi:hypothetical protein